MSYKVGSKCCTKQSLSGVDACIDSDVDADTDSGSADNGLRGVDCGDNDGDDASTDVERRDRSIGDDGGGNDAGVDMGDVGANSGLGDSRSALNSNSSDTQSLLTYGVIP